MTKRPLINALLAVVYICLISSVLFYGKGLVGPTDAVIMPIVMLSLLVLSASVMAMIFFYNPVMMYLDGDKKGAVSLIGGTIGIFAGITCVLLLAMFVFF